MKISSVLTVLSVLGLSFGADLIKKPSLHKSKTTSSIKAGSATGTTSTSTATSTSKSHRLGKKPSSSKLKPKIPGLPAGLPPLPPLSPEQKIAAKEIGRYFFPKCSQSCAVKAFIRGGCIKSIKNGDTGCICRAKFQERFLKCAKKKCSSGDPAQYPKIELFQRGLCRVAAPPCALTCLLGQPKKKCGLDPYCQCGADYQKDLATCINDSCQNKEDATRQLAVSKGSCDSLPPKCSFNCFLQSVTIRCDVHAHPFCVCNADDKAAFKRCLGYKCTPQQTDLLVQGQDAFCKAGKIVGDTIPPALPKEVSEALPPLAESLWEALPPPLQAYFRKGPHPKPGEAKDPFDLKNLGPLLAKLPPLPEGVLKTLPPPIAALLRPKPPAPPAVTTSTSTKPRTSTTSAISTSTVSSATSTTTSAETSTSTSDVPSTSSTSASAPTAVPTSTDAGPQPTRSTETITDTSIYTDDPTSSTVAVPTSTEVAVPTSAAPSPTSTSTSASTSTTEAEPSLTRTEETLTDAAAASSTKASLASASEAAATASATEVAATATASAEAAPTSAIA